MIPMFHGQNRNTFLSTYGRLYNWHSINTGKLAPSGWHIPTRTEIIELYNFLSTDQGSKLKETGYTHWLDTNTGALNSYNFNFVGAGARIGSDSMNHNPSQWGTYTHLKYSGTIWTSTIYNNDIAYSTGAHSGDNRFFIGVAEKNFGLSVRLIKDDSINTGFVTDSCNNVYPTIKIGNQVWTRQNLKTTKYNDGSIIPFAGSNGINFSDTEWYALTTPGVCAYNNDESYV